MIRVRPSCLQQCSLCPASARLGEAAREILAPVEAPIAQLGTDCHGIVALCLLWAVQDHDDEPREQIESRAAVEERADLLMGQRYAYLSGWDRWAIHFCIGYALDLIHRLEIAPADVLIEHRLDGADIGMSHGGTADVVLIRPWKLAVVIDWKFGLLEQDPAETNDQLASYAIMAARTFRGDEAHVHIVQPKLERGLRSTSASYDADALRETEEWVRGICAAAQDPEAAVVAGYEQCKYCDALVLCPAAREWIMNAMEAMELFGLPDDPRQWADLIGAAKMAERFGEEAKAAGKAHLRAGGSAPGWKLRSGGRIQSLKDAPAAFAIARERGMEATLIAACSVKLGELKSDLGPEATEQIFGSVIETKDRAPSLVACKE